MGGRTIYDGPDGSSVTLSDATITDNEAVGRAGGVGGNGGAGNGGGVFVGATEGSTTPSLTVSHSTIAANRAVGGAGGAGGSAGCGLRRRRLQPWRFHADDTTIEGNKASTGKDIFA